MAFCTECGANVPEDLKFCTGCGKPMGETPAQPIQPPPPVQKAQPQQPAQQPTQQPVQPKPPAEAANAAPPAGSQYAVVGVFNYIGLMLLFAIPIVGLIACLVMSFSKTNINRRNYARANLIFAIIALIISIFLIISIVSALNTFIEYLKEVTDNQLGGLKDLFDGLNGLKDDLGGITDGLDGLSSMVPGE